MCACAFSRWINFNRPWRSVYLLCSTIFFKIIRCYHTPKHIYAGTYLSLKLVIHKNYCHRFYFNYCKTITHFTIVGSCDKIMKLLYLHRFFFRLVFTSNQTNALINSNDVLSIGFCLKKNACGSDNLFIP